MKLTPQIRHAAVTLTELLVVLVIISILSTVALPVYINQSERARIATATQEVYEIGQAMEACGLVHGRFVPLQTLDDLPGSTGDLNDGSADAIQSSAGLNTIDFTQAASQLQSRGNNPLAPTSIDPRSVEIYENWEGPFINFQRYHDESPENTLNQNKADFPFDPWNNPYHFYSPVGHIGSPATNTGFSGSSFNGSLTGQDDRFDRWAIVSFGPDGVSDTASSSQGNRDDVVYIFGYTTAETSFNVTLPPTP
jgi:prepilin-type N-terminal cleavage/methylation domain-containing protein